MTGFPGLGLLRALRPTPAASADDGPSRRPAGCWPVMGPPGWFPRSLLTVRRMRRPAMPLRPRHAYAADIQRGLRGSDLFPPQEFPAQLLRVRVAAQPRSTRFELEGGLRSLQTLVSHVHLFVSLAGPGPSGSAGPSRRCQGCSRLLLRLQGQAALSFNRAAATSRRRCPFITARSNSASWRTRSPSQCPGTARSAASGGRSLIITSGVT